MTNSDIKKKVRQFKRKFGLSCCDYTELKMTAEKQGFTVIEFNHIFNDEAVQTLIDALKLSDSILRTKGFTYADQNYRLVFIHEDLNEEEKRMVLAHENGHIFLEHFSSLPVIGKDVREEYDANEFSHYLLNPSVGNKISDGVHRHRKPLIAIFAAILILISAITIISVVNKQKSYYGDYYVTESGNKYHEKGCIFVKDKSNVHRLTKSEFESGDYEACQTCLPK